MFYIPTHTPKCQSVLSVCLTHHFNIIIINHSNDTKTYTLLTSTNGDSKKLVSCCHIISIIKLHNLAPSAKCQKTMFCIWSNLQLRVTRFANIFYRLHQLNKIWVLREKKFFSQSASQTARYWCLPPTIKRHAADPSPQLKPICKKCGVKLSSWGQICHIPILNLELQYNVHYYKMPYIFRPYNHMKTYYTAYNK